MCCVLSHSVMPNSLRLYGLQPARLLCPWGFSRQEYWSGVPCPPPRDLPNPGNKPRSPTLQVDSSPTEPPGKPKNTGVGVAYPFSRGSSQPRNQTGISCIAGGFFTSWVIRAPIYSKTLASDVLFCSLCLVLVTGWWWLHKMTLGTFPAPQSFEVAWKGLVYVFYVFGGLLQ